MQEAMIDIPTAAGRMDTFITRPEGGPFPAVVIYMDIWGLREELFEIARRVATTGYMCLVPNFYYREGKVRYDTRDDQNKVVSVGSLDPAVRAVMLGSLGRLSNAMVIEDTGALLSHLAADAGALPGPMGAIGYCMGGRHVLCAATAFPERFHAVASLHGTEMVSDHADAPQRKFGALRGELYCGFGEKDPHTAPPLVATMAELLRPCAVAYHHEVHKGAEHGYALPDRDVYDSRAAARDWELIHAMFRRQIPTGA
jgi:carboxymethylenebutenolidase